MQGCCRAHHSPCAPCSRHNYRQELHWHDQRDAAFERLDLAGAAGSPLLGLVLNVKVGGWWWMDVMGGQARSAPGWAVRTSLLGLHPCQTPAARPAARCRLHAHSSAPPPALLFACRARAW